MISALMFGLDGRLCKNFLNLVLAVRTALRLELEQLAEVPGWGARERSGCGRSSVGVVLVGCCGLVPGCGEGGAFFFAAHASRLFLFKAALF